MAIKTKRVYEKPARGDGWRVLVDRLWPRGLSKDGARLDEWVRDVAPSHSLRQWFDHDPSRWEEFQRRYSAELDGVPQVWRLLLARARRGPITLVYAARDPDHNNAVALMRYLTQHGRAQRLDLVRQAVRPRPRGRAASRRSDSGRNASS